MTHEVPFPDDVESHPYRYPWERRGFHDVRVVTLGEGTSVYSAVGENAFWIVHDSRTFAHFLDEDDNMDLLTLHRYNDRVRWKTAIAALIERDRALFDEIFGHIEEREKLGLDYETRRKEFEERTEVLQRERAEQTHMTIVKGLYLLYVGAGSKPPWFHVYPSRRPSADAEAPVVVSGFQLCDPNGDEVPGGRRVTRLDVPVLRLGTARWEALLAGLALTTSMKLPYVAVFSDSRPFVNGVNGLRGTWGRSVDCRNSVLNTLKELVGWQVSWIPPEWNKARTLVEDALSTI